LEWPVLTHACSGFVLCSRFVNGKSGDVSLLEGAIRRFPRIMIPSAFSALMYWAIFHWSSLDGRVCHQVVLSFDGLTMPCKWVVN